MFLEVHLYLVIRDVGQSELPNIQEDLKDYPGWHSFAEWTYIPDRKCYECWGGYMSCYGGKYQNYFAANNIEHRSGSIGASIESKPFAGGCADVSDPMSAGLYELMKAAKRNSEESST